MKDQVRVALAQIAIESLEPERNLARLIDACREAAGEGADLVVFPELVDLGQVPEPEGDFAARYLAAAQPVPGPFTEEVGKIAAELGLHVVVGLAERHPDIGLTVFDSAALILPTGELAGVQRKLHTAGAERHYFGRGDAVRVFPTELGMLSVQVCYDLYFPEVCRSAALAGAEILLGLFNVTDRPEWEDRLGTLAAVRAYENMQHVVFVNRVGENRGRTFGGESVAVEPPGTILARAPRGEEALIVVPLLQATLARERARRPVFADRRPDVYGSWGDERGAEL